MKITLRTPETEKIYADYRKTADLSECPMCREAKNGNGGFKYWVIVPNRFPYDRVFSTSHLLITKRHCEKMSAEEMAELEDIKGRLYPKYEQLLENLGSSKTIPIHCHYHLLKI